MKKNELKRKILKSGLGLGTTLATIFMLNGSVNALEQTPDKCFVMDGNTIIDYLCYEGNDNGYETIIDVVIPSVINGENVNSIAAVDSTSALTDTDKRNGAFSNKKIKSVVIPSSITTIGQYAFYNNNISEINIPNSVIEIGENAFSYNEISNLVIPNSVKKIKKGAFQHNNISDLSLPTSLVEMESHAFKDNKLTNVVIPSSITVIDAAVFENNLLTKVTIPDSVTKISYGQGSGAFKNNQLTEITIPKNVTYVGPEAFANNKIKVVYNNSQMSNDDLQKNIAESCQYVNEELVCGDKLNIKILNSNEKNPKTLDLNSKNFIIVATICMVGITGLLLKTSNKKKCK